MTDVRKDWWRAATIYQVYIRSFADGNGDGEGDIAGLRQALPYLSDLGVDAIWINPWYPSPLNDGGYDVADYRNIDPRFGDLTQAKALLDEAHGMGLKIILDIVPNHSSSEHEWFQAALAAQPGSPERERYIFRDGLGPDGSQPPNNWLSVFGGSAWERITEPDGSPGQWYFHIFDVTQPDFDWDNPEVRAEFLDVLRFWFDLGVDGFRIDVAHGMVKDMTAPDLPYDESGLLDSPTIADHPFFDREGVHDIYRGWRELADSYDPPRLFVAEAWVEPPERLARYVRDDELHSAFNFDYLKAPWTAQGQRQAIERSTSVLRNVGAPATWVLENHDVERIVSRYGRTETDAAAGHLRKTDERVDEELGRRRARAAALLMLSLPGGAYIYQGQELGLPEVTVPDEAIQDPVWERSGYTKRGRDGCRVPLPWRVDGPSYGFGPDGSWLPQPEGWGQMSVQAQSGDPQSMLELYRAALRIRREHPALATETMTWLDGLGDDVLAFVREPRFECVVNFGAEPVALPEHQDVLLASAPLTSDGRLPGDTTVWLAT
ncbi:glycoside hydrolase family 13 protein [Actinobacteria bacterium YIM 96077]|uniref:Alpha-glucosidase n=1 Tax=Phytoactinopolyspora halophila TaxID=1981511 RepID=A0A329QR04_9ACTN|nr:glycoside hydrolase family 13 protein [Phytoactinopolyspora halophila]AYY12300.1 glycoside hydrolase family 13 protein [Actinobacteria bacterium YIM 96077]RAW13782.1 alpha-glucosidase [Phytoactinopolyspora halophila]